MAMSAVWDRSGLALECGMNDPADEGNMDGSGGLMTENRRRKDRLTDLEPEYSGL